MDFPSLETRARKMRWGLGAQSVACILIALMCGTLAWFLAQEASPVAPVLLVAWVLFILLSLVPPFLYFFWCRMNGYPPRSEP